MPSGYIRIYSSVKDSAQNGAPTILSSAFVIAERRGRRSLQSDFLINKPCPSKPYILQAFRSKHTCR